jgi:hypothetical protein
LALNTRAGSDGSSNLIIAPASLFVWLMIRNTDRLSWPVVDYASADGSTVVIAALTLGPGVQINLDLVSFSRRRIALFAIGRLYHQVEILDVPERAKARAEIYAALQLLLNPLINSAAPHRVRQSVNLGRESHLSGLRRASQRGSGRRRGVAPLKPVQKRPDEGRSDRDESNHDCARPQAQVQ